MRQIYKLCMCTRVHALTHHHHHHRKEIYETSSWLWVYEEQFLFIFCKFPFHFYCYNEGSSLKIVCTQLYLSPEKIAITWFLIWRNPRYKSKRVIFHSSSGKLSIGGADTSLLTIFSYLRSFQSSNIESQEISSSIITIWTAGTVCQVTDFSVTHFTFFFFFFHFTF